MCLCAACKYIRKVHERWESVLFLSQVQNLRAGYLPASLMQHQNKWHALMLQTSHIIMYLMKTFVTFSRTRNSSAILKQKARHVTARGKCLPSAYYCIQPELADFIMTEGKESHVQRMEMPAHWDGQWWAERPGRLIWTVWQIEKRNIRGRGGGLIDTPLLGWVYLKERVLKELHHPWSPLFS